MTDTVVVLVNGEVLANGQSAAIKAQRENAIKLAEGLLPLFASESKVMVLHGNKPQVGFVLFRSELASHVLHAIPLDVCGADTQGATGFMLSQAFDNVLRNAHISRSVLSVITQTLVDNSSSDDVHLKAIGPWYDREKAEQYRQTRGWKMVEEPGSGYRRAVPSLPAKEILEFNGIQHLVESGAVVIGAGGGGIPVILNAEGNYEGFEAVLDTAEVAVLMARGLKARTLLIVIESDRKFALAGFPTEASVKLSLTELDYILKNQSFSSESVNTKLHAASDFLHSGGEQVIITTLRKLESTMANRSGLRITSTLSSIEAFPSQVEEK